MEILMMILAAISLVDSINEQRNRIEYIILEEKPIGTFVGKLSKQKEDTQFLQYMYTDKFLTNERTGEISTKQIIDRENMTELQKLKGFNFYVLQDKSKNISIVVKVVDINDNIPKFHKPVLHINIDWNAKVGTLKKLINAVDLDEGTNAVITYNIVDDVYKKFELKTIKINNQANLYVSLKSPLNIEQQPNMVLNISACDSLIHVCSYMLLNITLTRTKSNMPKFLKERYYAEVYENVSIGHIFLQVKAIDADSRSNDRIVYSMFDNFRQFSIDPKSGDVYVRRKLDAETRVSYMLVVIANYNGKSPKRATVTVTVLDCNDNPPNVSVKYLYTNGYNVIEGASVGTKVVMLSVKDIDKDAKNKKVILKLLDNQGYFDLQKHDSTYSVFVNKTIDRELTPRFTLQIYASDTGTPPLHTLVKIPLEVGDINDNAPKFKGIYNVSVNESMGVGYKVLKVQAFDSDLGVNALVSYHITYASVKKWFVIVEDTGVIYISNPLDREKSSHVILEVSAKDHGNPQRSSKSSVNITIIDCNDNHPYFKPPMVVLNITENNVVPCSIGFVKAFDMDIVGTDELHYSVNNPIFYVSPIHGEIKVMKKLDREEKNRYVFNVYATDGGGMQGSVKIILNVLDVNDNAPLFKQVFYNITVHENFPVGGIVAYVSATDIDEAENSIVLYSCNVTQGLFSVDSHSGGVILREKLTKQKKQISSFTVTVQDTGKLKGNNSAIVVVKIVPPCLKAPVFEQSFYNFTLIENNFINMTIGHIIASRPESGSIAFINYRIKGGNRYKMFSIDAFGVIKAAQKIDYEFKHIYELDIEATDTLNITLKVNVTVFITVIDQNDNAPIFVTINPSITVDEGHPVGYVFYKCKATDLDSGANGFIRYEIINSSGPFDIDGGNGLLFTNGTLDYELMQSYDLYINAYDLGEPVLKSTIKMTIHVLDVNDNPPLFEQSSYVINVKENVAVGNEIIKLNAYDRDSGTNGMFNFQLDDTVDIIDAGSFMLSDDGILMLRKRIDREVKDSYTFKALVQDEGIPSQKSTARIRISVEDVNDEIPKFDYLSYTFELREELPAGTTIGAVVIKDADIGKNGEVTCSLLNHNDKFKINSRYASFYDQSVCTISSRRIFDREKHEASYNVTIIAKDHGTPANTNQVDVKINIKNVHDLPPKFSQNLPYLACVVYGTPKNFLVTKIVATDNDAMPLPLNYSLIAMTESENAALSLFWISHVDGSVYTKTSFSNQTLKSVYEVTIRIKEFGSYNAMYNYQKLIIFIVPKVQKTIFRKHCKQACVRESQLPSKGAIIHGYEIQHSFQITNIRNYEIKKDEHSVLPFKILTETGLIRLTSQLNHKNQPYYQLNVTAEGWQETKSYKDSMIVNIYVVPKNLNPPSYPSNPEDFTIHENIQPLDSFTTLKKANDLDYGMEGSVMYSIAETMPVDAPISISPLSRELVFTDFVDREKIEQFVVKVRMTDLALDLSQRLSNTFTVYLSVLDINDNPPIFKSRNNSYVYEDDPIGTTVMTIQAEDPDKGKTNTHILYEIVSGNENEIFKLERHTGHLLTNKSLNIYECQKYVLQIKAYELREPQPFENITSLESTMVLSVDIIDVNDNPPIFTSSKYYVSVAENMVPGTKVVQVNASDADLSFHNKQFIFELLDNQNLFDIDARSGIITTKTILDREKDSLHTITIMVKNLAMPLADDSCTVIINVTDVNDFPPVFSDGQSVELHVMENTPPATLHKFIVSDPDLGSNAAVEYQIHSTENITGIFYLNKYTGCLLLLKMLDREECDKYMFSIEAINTSPPYHKATQHATVVVDDENDEKPVFSKKKYQVVVSEDEEVNATIVKVSAIDRDSGTNANIIYTILNDSENTTTPFGINADTGEIFLIKQLDYEKQKQHLIRIKANGFGFESYNLTVVVVDVKDINDNSPIFSKPIYNVSIEKVQTELPVLQIQATDADEDGMQRIRYQFSPYNHEFLINKNTGEIHIKNQKLTFGQYRLHVKAKDDAYPRQQAFAQVLISIGDANNNILYFLNSTVVFSLMENPPQDYNLGIVVAKSHGSQPVFYNIVETSNPQYAFAVKRTTGEIYVNNSLAVDYEKHPSFFLGVIAFTQHENKFHSSYLSVLVNLSDANDNVPEIIPTYEKFSYPETNRKDFTPTYMHLFHVYDADNIDEGKLDIQIISGNDNKVFAINDWRHLLVVKNVDYEVQRQYNLVVRVKDSAKHYSDSRIIIEVEDRNDNPPMFKEPLVFFVSESTLKGSVIANVTAVDADVTSTDITYCIESPYSITSLFEIEKYLGSIRLLEPLDYEKQSIYHLNISAFDGIHHTYQSFEINILDENDNIPQFTERVYLVKVWPELKKNANIAKVTAIDFDHSIYGHVQYQIDPPKDAFTIEQDTGIIFTNKDFKFSPEIYSFKLTVIAFDSYGGDGSLQSSATVNLIISGQKPIIPRFLSNKYHMSISEGASIGTTIDQVIATLPSGLHQKMKYSIEGGNRNEAFSIDVHKGLLTVNNKVDRESIDYYTLELVARAHGSNKSARCIAVIKILDANDNAPKFENASYNVVVLENITVGHSLLQMKATDSDEPGSDNAFIKYEIHSGQDKFDWLMIDPYSGWVKTQKTLDREICESIQLTIKASDHRGSGKTALTSLNVTVLDVNDNTPRFSLDIPNIHQLEVDENQPANTIVFKAKATDADDGSNGRVSYHILDGVGKKVFYMKESETGWVYTRGPLNYEENHLYNLTVLAYDHGIPLQKASFEFLINVKDVDEYDPTFTESSYEFKILGNMKMGQEIGQIKANDRDTGPAGIIRYTFTSFLEEFSINEKTGLIMVKDDLRRPTYSVGNVRSVRSINNDLSEYPLEVRADNGPNSTRYSIVPVRITVNYSCADCFKDAGFMQDKSDSLNSSTLVVVFASISVFVILLVVICLAVYCRRKQACYHKRKHPPPRFCPSKKGEVSPGSSLERELLNSGTSSIDRLPTHFFTEYSSKPGTYISSETGIVPGSASGTARTTSGTDKASTFSFGIYHEQAIPESEMHPFSDNLSDMSLKDLEQDSVFAYPSAKAKKNAKICASRSTKESSLYSLSSNPQKDSVNLTSRQTSLPQSSRQDSHESLKDFMEEGGGEAAGGIDVGNLLYAKLAVVDADEQDAVMDGVQAFNEEGLPSRGGSLSTIIGSDVDLRSNYNRNYMDNWGPEFNAINDSVFTAVRHTDPTQKCALLNKKKDNASNNENHRISKLNNLSHPGSNKDKKRGDEMTMGLLNSSSSCFTSRACSPNFTSAMTPLVFRTSSVSSIGRNENLSLPGGSYQSNLFDTVINIGVLHRNGSVGSQLSRITLSDINVSDDEIAL